MNSVEETEYIEADLSQKSWWRSNDIKLAFRVSLTLDLVSINFLPQNFSSYGYHLESREEKAKYVILFEIIFYSGFTGICYFSEYLERRLKTNGLTLTSILISALTTCMFFTVFLDISQQWILIILTVVEFLGGISSCLFYYCQLLYLTKYQRANLRSPAIGISNFFIFLPLFIGSLVLYSVSDKEEWDTIWISVASLPFIFIAIYLALKLPKKSHTRTVKRKYPVAPLIVLFIAMGILISLSYGILPAYAELEFELDLFTFATCVLAGFLIGSLLPALASYYRFEHSLMIATTGIDLVSGVFLGLEEFGGRGAWMFYVAGVTIGISAEILDTILCKYLSLSKRPRRSFALYRFIYGLTAILTMVVQYYCITEPWVFFGIYFGSVTVGKFFAPRLSTVITEGNIHMLT